MRAAPAPPALALSPPRPPLLIELPPEAPPIDAAGGSLPAASLLVDVPPVLVGPPAMIREGDPPLSAPDGPETLVPLDSGPENFSPPHASVALTIRQSQAQI
jgi:hypothetical protein